VKVGDLFVDLFPDALPASSTPLFWENFTGDLRIDHREVCPGDIFLALPGEKEDGSRYGKSALEKGAILVISQSPPPEEGLPWVTIPSLTKELPRLVRRIYPVKENFLRIFGVTGTNGKTTVTRMVVHLLRSSGVSSAWVGTIRYEGPGYEEVSRNTTPHRVDLERLISRWQNQVRDGFLGVAMEVSSHALKQNRLFSFPFHAVALTQIGRDHLDYHRTMEEYIESKLRIFSYPVPEGEKGNGWAFVPTSYLSRVKTSRQIVRMGEGGDISWLVEKVTLTGTEGILSWFGKEIFVSLPFVGEFQLANASYALGMVSCVMGEPPEKYLPFFSTFSPPPGRMEFVTYKPFPVVVDYAHTPDAMEKVLSTLRPLVSGRLIVVFGCGGDRDRGKRPEMGGVAEKWGDLLVLTSDNPRSEPPLKIIEEILSGIKERKKVLVEEDRKKAIGVTLKNATENDLVAILGKGHESYQEIGTKRYPFSDREVVKGYFQ